ncbi:MAG: AMP-binding protein, partial [Dehalococcoidia bacterium]|nr:AMP-binding protein [Dehalococcoidia bacterium]
MTRDRYDYPAGLYDPNYQPELGETMFQSLDRITERFPDREALVDRDQRLTFMQYRASAARLAAHLHHLGI